MRELLIELHIPGQERGEFFILEHPTYEDPGFYPQCVSYSYFRDRELKRAFPDVLSGELINGMNWVKYATTIKYCSEHSTHGPIKWYLDNLNIDIQDVPVCKGVWDFYNKIGYDKKRKKYL